MYSSSSSSGNFSTSSSKTSASATQPLTSFATTSGPSAKGQNPSTPLSTSGARPTSFLTSPVTTPSAYLTLGGIGGSSASISAASYLPSILDNNNIEQTFIDISSVPVSTSSTAASQQHRQSGFVPPVIDPPARGPSFAANSNASSASTVREQIHPSDLSVRSSEVSHLEDPRPDHSRGAEHLHGAERSKYNNNNNNNNINNTSRKSSIGAKNTPASHSIEATNLSSRGDNNNMVANNANVSIQGQLANWNIPAALSNTGAHNHTISQQNQQQHQQQQQQFQLAQIMASSAAAATSATMTPGKQQGGPRRHTGPRPPKSETNLSPEEAERRRVRRERNKLAAAKCRKRRMDHTAQLQEETEELESVQREIHSEILSLQQQKEQLEFILQAHKVHCKRGIPFTPLPAVFIPPLTLSSAGGGGEDGGLKDELAGNLSNDSHSSTTSNYSPAPTAQQMQMTTTTAAMATGAARPINSINNNNINDAATVGHPTSFAGMGIGKNNNNNNNVGGVVAMETNNPTPTVVVTTAAAPRPNTLPINIKQEPPFLPKTESQQQLRPSALPHNPSEGAESEDVKPEAMDVNVTRATGISISTPKVSPRVLSFFDVMGDHTGLTPITGGGVISSVGSASGTPISGSGSAAAVAGFPGATTSALTPPTTKMGTPTDRSNNGAEKLNSGQQQTYTSL